MSRPIHFELSFEDAERAKNFYGTVFGWSYQKYGDESAHQIILHYWFDQYLNIHGQGAI